MSRTIEITRREYDQLVRIRNIASKAKAYAVADNAEALENYMLLLFNNLGQPIITKASPARHLHD